MFASGHSVALLPALKHRPLKEHFYVAVKFFSTFFSLNEAVFVQFDLNVLSWI